MAKLFKSKRPDRCHLKKAEITNETYPFSGTRTVPDRSSTAYIQTLADRRGTFDKYEYQYQGGLYIEEQFVEERTRRVATFTCMRTAQLGMEPITSVTESQVVTDSELTRSLFNKVGGMGLCEACPFNGMNELKANTLRAQMDQAAAEQMTAELARRQAHAELEEFLRGNQDQ